MAVVMVQFFRDADTDPELGAITNTVMRHVKWLK
jgi:hypothetical protein